MDAATCYTMSMTARTLATLLLLMLGAVTAPLDRVHAYDLFTSLEAPPTVDEVRAATTAGVHNFDFDLEQPAADMAVRAIKEMGGRIAAYHIGGGGGRDWGSVRAGEWVRHYDSPRDFLALTEDVKHLVSLGADLIHFDNTHRFSGRRLEAITDAIIAGGAGIVAKNNPAKWALTMQRRPDLRPAYAVIEDALFDQDVTQDAYALHARGVPVYIIGFRRSLNPQAPTVMDEYAQAYADSNPWARVLLMADERAFDSRTGIWVRPNTSPASEPRR